jgi:hypothetical protein
MGILVGIDGTGSAMLPGSGRDKDYDIAFADSFVRRICLKGGPYAKYFRGPVALGGGLMNAIAGGRQHIVATRSTAGAQPVLLTGYSRGAAGVVALAKELKDLDISVEAILLFDCVDRHVGIDADVIPENVAHVFHVVRDPATSSRESFGNDGLRYHAGKTSYDGAFKFMCTHGGMGGCPWKAGPGQSPNTYINEGFGAGWWDGATKVTYAQDAAVSATVWQTVQPFINAHGFMN